MWRRLTGLREDCGQQGARGDCMTVDEFFAGREASRHIFDALRAAIKALGPADIRVSKSQVAFRRDKAFAWAWIPDMYLRGRHAPLVLTLSLNRRDDSPRWNEIAEPSPGRFTHHLELHSASAIDAQVRHWLQEAWQAAAQIRHAGSSWAWMPMSATDTKCCSIWVCMRRPSAEYA